jgi:mercuric ion transport protein
MMKRDKMALGGAILAATGASLCCIGPLLFAAVGIGAFGAAGVFQSARPYLLFLAAAILGAGFYREYVRREKCAPGEACLTQPANRTGRAALWLAAIGVVAFALAPHYIGPIAAAFVKKPPSPMGQTVQSPSPSNPVTATIRIQGMDCAACEAPIKRVLALTPGVQSADVSYQRRNAVVTFDSAKTDVDHIKEAISSTGFEAEIGETD